MIIEIYGDSFVYGGSINWEYAVKNKYIDNFWDFKKISEKHREECDDFLIKNRWITKLEKELNVTIRCYGFPGHGWQYIQYRFLKNEIKNKNSKEEIFYIFCPPRVSFKRLLISSDFDEKDWNLVKGENFSTLNITPSWIDKRLNKELYENVMLLNNLFPNSVTDQLNFQNVFGILNYLILNKKKFIFLPSWLDSTKNSFIFENQEKADNFEKNKKNIFIFFDLNKKIKSEDNDVYDLYEKYIFDNIEDFFIKNFWNKNENNKLPSGHPNIEAQEIIKNKYAKIIKNVLYNKINVRLFC